MEYTFDKLKTKEEYLERYPISSGKEKLHGAAFKNLDYVVVAIAVMFVIYISFFGYTARLKRFEKTGDSFTDVGLTFLATSASMSIAFISSLAAMGMPAEVYFRNIMVVWELPSVILSTVVCNKVFLPVFFNLGLQTTHQYLGLRFNKRIQLLFGVFYIFRQIVYLQLVLHSCMTFVTEVGGFPMKVFFNVICLFYTICITLGGIRAMVWADVINLSLMVAGFIIIIYSGKNVLHAEDEYMEALKRTGRLTWNEASFSIYTRHSIWSIGIGEFVLWTSMFSCSQTMMQRCLCCKNFYHAVMSTYVSNIFAIVLRVLFIIAGLLIAAYYIHCDPLYGLPDTAKEIFSAYVHDVGFDFEGFAGLVTVCHLTACMSTFGSELHSMATVFMIDIFQIFDTLKDVYKLRLGQIICLSLGVFSIIFQLHPELDFSNSSLQMSKLVNGILEGSFLGVFSLAILVPHANAAGAVCGLLVSVMFTFVAWLLRNDVTPGKVFSDTACNGSTLHGYNISQSVNHTTLFFKDGIGIKSVFDISFLFFCVMSFVISFFTGLFVTFITEPTDPLSLDPKLIFPFFDRVYPFFYLSKKLREKLRFGMAVAPPPTMETPITKQDDFRRSSFSYYKLHQKMQKHYSLTSEIFDVDISEAASLPDSHNIFDQIGWSSNVDIKYAVRDDQLSISPPHAIL